MDIGIWENVQETSERDVYGQRLYTSNCKFCGMKRIATLSNLKQAKKCKHIKTGIKNHRILHTFVQMKKRCNDENSKDFRFYGARGIKVCDEWMKDPKRFEEWALSNGYEDSLTIDRIDPRKGYCPENCRWISSEDNSRYKSTTITMTVNSQEKTGRQWAQFIGVGQNTINAYRRTYGMEKTEEFIEYVLSNGLPKRITNQSYMDAFMKERETQIKK